MNIEPKLVIKINDYPLFFLLKLMFGYNSKKNKLPRE